MTRRGGADGAAQTGQARRRGLIGPAVVAGLAVLLTLAPAAPGLAGAALDTAHGRDTGAGVRPRLVGSSPKPGWRGADSGNTGVEAVSGPAAAPVSVFDANPKQGGVTQGIELDGAGNVLFTTGDGFLYSYNPASGTRNWVVSAGSSTFGSDTLGAASAPVASADGHVYLADDTGHVLSISAATGVSTQLLAYGAPVAQTLAVDDAAGALFFGGQDQYINRYTTAGTTVYSVRAPGSTQDGVIAGCAGATSGAARFYGVGALDSTDNFYIASLEPKTGGPPACGAPTFGTLYKVSPSGTLLASAPLAGGVVGAVVLTTNPLTPTNGELVVGATSGYVEAFDAATLVRLWAVKVAAASITASPAVDAARGRVYVADTADSLHALSLATGAPDTRFNGTGVTALTGGTPSSPLVDAGGNVYIVDSTGALLSFDPSGATRYSVTTGLGTGFFSTAIGADGTLYVGGNVGQVGGFAGAVSATGTAAARQSATAGTAAAQQSATAGAAATATAGAPTATPGSALPTPTNTPPPAPGADLASQDTSNARYIAGANGQTELRLYNAPVGFPDVNGWRLRAPGLRPVAPVAVSTSAVSPVPLLTSLALAQGRQRDAVLSTPGVLATTVAVTDSGVVTATGPISPAALPFGLQVASQANSPALAAFRNEEDISLTLGLSSLGGAAPAPVPGVVGGSGDAITYTAPSAAPADLALRPTISGLDLRLVLRSATATGPLVLAPVFAPGTRLVQEGGGDLRVTRDVTATTDSGQPYTQTLPEYVFAAPLAHDSAPDAADHTIPVSLTLTTIASGGPGVALRVDPAWLADPARVFPVKLDLPVATAASATRGGWFGAVNRCTPTLSAGQTEMVVGTRGSCVAHGQAYFDTTTLLPDTPIVSATLHLDTPDQTGATGVQAYQNAPAARLGQLYYPTWNTQPALITGTAGLAQSGSEGHGQRWDVTDIVRQWVAHAQTNTGLTVINDGVPVRFASPLGAGDGAPGEAPYLDIVYGPRPAVSPLYSDAVPATPVGVSPHLVPHIRSNTVPVGDGASSIWGLSGSFGDCLATAPTCTAQNPNGTYDNAMSTTWLANTRASYARFGVTLQCNRNNGYTWWTSTRPHHRFGALPHSRCRRISA